jgi:hypothetical protein
MPLANPDLHKILLSETKTFCCTRTLQQILHFSRILVLHVKFCQGAVAIPRAESQSFKVAKLCDALIVNFFVPCYRIGSHPGSPISKITSIRGIINWQKIILKKMLKNPNIYLQPDEVSLQRI